MTCKNLAVAKRKHATLMLAFDDQDQFKMQQLIEEFSAKARLIGVDLKMADRFEE